LCQSAALITYSGIVTATLQKYNSDEKIITFVLGLSALSYIPAVPLLMWAFSVVNRSLQRITIVASLVVFVGTFGRCLSFISPQTNWGFWLISISQLLISLPGPVYMIAPTKLSVRWFAVEERTIATAMAISTNNLGSAIGLIVEPLLLNSFGYEISFVIEAGVCGVGFLLCLFCFSDAPPSPPTLTAKMDDTTFKCSQFCKDLKDLVTNYSYLLLVLVGGWLNGTALGLQGTLELVLRSQYDETILGWYAFTYVICATFGSICGGFFGDKLFTRRFKMALICLVLLDGIYFVLLSLFSPSLFSEDAIVVLPTWAMFLVMVIGGFLSGIPLPVIYEFGVELSYPVSPSVSAGLYSMITSIVYLGSLLLTTYAQKRYLISSLGFSLIFCVIPLSFISERYRRSDVDRPYVPITLIDNE